MTQERAADDKAAGNYDRAAAAVRREQLLAHLAEVPGPTIGELLAAEPAEGTPTAEDSDVMLQTIYDARDQDLARRTRGA
jgi:hypothetical protein